jgi:cytochrome c biogenesis protein CcmG/thiol:disulfide interchange protein DsbE
VRGGRVTARQQWAVVLAVVAVLGGALFAATRLLGDELFPVTVGSAAPTFSAREIDPPARVKSLADYQGQVVLLNIWATWCEPCRAEMPSMQALHETFGDRGLRVVAVSVDDPGTEDKIRAFRRDFGLTFEVLHNPSGDIQRLYQTTGVPETFVIGPDGTIRKKVNGAADWHSAANRALIAQLVGAPAEGAAGPDTALSQPLAPAGGGARP